MFYDLILLPVMTTCVDHFTSTDIVCWPFYQCWWRVLAILLVLMACVSHFTSADVCWPFYQCLDKNRKQDGHTMQCLSMSCANVLLRILFTLGQSLDFRMATWGVTLSYNMSTRLLNIVLWSGVFTPANYNIMPQFTNLCTIRNKISNITTVEPHFTTTW